MKLTHLLLIVLQCLNSAKGFPLSISVRWPQEFCLGGDKTLSSTYVKLTYNFTEFGETRTSTSTVLIRKSNNTEIYNFSYPGTGCYDAFQAEAELSQRAEYYFEQPEHGGGLCNCIDIDFNLGSDQTRRVPLCNGSASIPRRLEVKWSAENSNEITKFIPNEAMKVSPIQLDCTTTPYVSLSFMAIFNRKGEGCNFLDGFNEGVDFSVRISSAPHDWIPIRYIFHRASAREADRISIGNNTENFTLRGYKVDRIQNSNTRNITVTICNISTADSFQFRWLQTVATNKDNTTIRDAWIMDDLKISVVTSDNQSIILLEEDYNGVLNTSYWPDNHVRNANITNFCERSDGLVFSSSTVGVGQATLSNSLLTKTFSLRSQPSSSQFDENYDPFQDRNITNSDAINACSDLVPTAVISLLQEKSNDRSVNSELIAATFQLVSQNLAGTLISRSKFEILVETGNNILQLQKVPNSRLAETILFGFDDLLFSFAPETGTFASANFALRSVVININSLGSTNQIVSINTSNIDAYEGPELAVTIPLELLREFAINGSIRIIASAFKQISSLFSEEIEEHSTLGPDIVSSSLQCGRGRCPTSNYTLQSSNVTITFQHSFLIKEMLERQKMDVKCVFLKIIDGNRSIWSSRGCTRNTSLSSTSRTVCDCNHLTHFAILLSPRPPELSASVRLSLNLISYIGVAVSIVAMGATIFTFIMLKSLRGMRTYIHINLCITLSIAQIIFVAGADKTGPPNGDVPIHCQVIAVLLHYFFLTTFMWMLMEGVILYVALVCVFVKHKRRYIFAFTMISYGLPLLYVSILCLPLGYTLNDKQNYGYEEACFLNYKTNFIWAFITPVIIIFLSNIGFFLMAIKIMWHHQSKRIDKTKVQNVKSWLKGAVSLVVIMGLTWIMGILIIRLSVLITVAYIFTILVAFQGLFIFLNFVVFSKAVREAYKQWWKVRVSESEILSKYFGQQLSSTGRTATNSKSDAVSKSSSSSKDKRSMNDYVFVSSTKNEEEDNDSLKSDYQNIPLSNSIS